MSEQISELSGKSFSDLLEKAPPRRHGGGWFDRVGTFLMALSVNPVTRAIVDTKGDIRKWTGLVEARNDADAYAVAASQRGNNVLHLEIKDLIGKVDDLKSRLAQPRCRRMVEAARRVKDKERVRAYVSACGLMYGVLDMAVKGARQIESGGLFQWLSGPKNKRRRDLYWDFKELHDALGDGGLMSALRGDAAKAPASAPAPLREERALEAAEKERSERFAREVSSIRMRRNIRFEDAEVLRRRTEEQRIVEEKANLLVENGASPDFASTPALHEGVAIRWMAMAAKSMRDNPFLKGMAKTKGDVSKWKPFKTAKAVLAEMEEIRERESHDYVDDFSGRRSARPPNRKAFQKLIESGNVIGEALESSANRKFFQSKLGSYVQAALAAAHFQAATLALSCLHNRSIREKRGPNGKFNDEHMAPPSFAVLSYLISDLSVNPSYKAVVSMAKRIKAGDLKTAVREAGKKQKGAARTEAIIDGDVFKGALKIGGDVLQSGKVVVDKGWFWVTALVALGLAFLMLLRVFIRLSYKFAGYLADSLEQQARFLKFRSTQVRDAKVSEKQRNLAEKFEEAAERIRLKATDAGEDAYEEAKKEVEEIRKDNPEAPDPKDWDFG